jgi:integrase
MGTIYKRGNTWWIKYHKNGKPYYESTHTDKEKEAKRLLQKREGDIAQGKTPGIYYDKVKFDRIAELYLTDYKLKERKTLSKAERCVRYLKEAFDGLPVTDITTDKVNNYMLQRQEDGAANGTINRELAALKRMLNLGAQQTPPLVERVLYITMKPESSPREGFFKPDEFKALRDNLPEYLKGIVTFGYRTGWRISEILNLTWSKVDLEECTVQLEKGTTKNGDGRIIYLDEELKGIFIEQHKKQKALKTIIPYVFMNESGTDRIKDIRGSWDKACKKAGLGKRLFHDFRRTAVRNLTRSGTPEKVVMNITGHKTRSVFDRYNITDTKDLEEAAIRQHDWLERERSERERSERDRYNPVILTGQGRL